MDKSKRAEKGPPDLAFRKSLMTYERTICGRKKSRVQM